MKYELVAPFKSISGIVEKRRTHDGGIEVLIARKDGTMYWKRQYPRRRTWSRDGHEDCGTLLGGCRSSR